MIVRIQATERVVYDKTINISKNEFNRLKKLIADGVGSIPADDLYIDVRDDIVDGFGLEDISIEIAR